MICDNCGKRLNEGDAYCSSCGAKVEIKVPEYTAPTQERGYRRPSGQGEKSSDFRVTGMNWDLNGYPGKRQSSRRETSMNWSSVQDSRDKKQVESLMSRRTSSLPDDYERASRRDRGFEQSSVFFRNDESEYAPAPAPKTSEFTEADLLAETATDKPKETPSSTYRMEKEKRPTIALGESNPEFHYGESVFAASRGVEDQASESNSFSAGNTYVYEKVDISDAIQEMPKPGEEFRQQGFEPEFKNNSYTPVDYTAGNEQKHSRNYTGEFEQRFSRDYTGDYNQDYERGYTSEFEERYSKDYTGELDSLYSDKRDWDDDRDDYDDFGKRRESFGGKFVAGVASIFGKLEKFARFDRDDDDFDDRDFDDRDFNKRNNKRPSGAYDEDGGVFVKNQYTEDDSHRNDFDSNRTSNQDFSWDTPVRKNTSRKTTALDDWQKDIQEASQSKHVKSSAPASTSAQGREKFFTFNQKSAEFQALLDEEYERLRKRIQEESDEPRYSKPQPVSKNNVFDAVVQKKSEEPKQDTGFAANVFGRNVLEHAQESVNEEPEAEPTAVEETEEPIVEPVEEATIVESAENEAAMEPVEEPAVVEETEEPVEEPVEEATIVESAENEAAMEPEAEPAAVEETEEPVEEPIIKEIVIPEPETSEFDREIVKPLENDTPASESVKFAEEVTNKEEATPEVEIAPKPEQGIVFENDPDPEDPELYEFERRISELEGQVEHIGEHADERTDESEQSPILRSSTPEPKQEPEHVEKKDDDLNKTRVFRVEEVKSKLHSSEENEFQRPLRYGDIFSNSGSIDYDSREKSGRGKIIILDILIAILAIAVILTAFMVFGRNTAIGQKIAGLFGGGTQTEETVDTENTEETTAETTTNTVTEISPLANAIIKQAVRNTNIGEIAEDTALKFVEGKDYGMTDLQYASLFTDADWYTTGSGETVTYLPELVGHVIEYYSKLVNRYNNGSDEVLDLIDPYANYYYDILAIEPEEGVTRMLSKLQIGEIRRNEDEFYMLVRLMYDISNEENPYVVTRVIRLDTSQGSVYVEDIETVTDLESTTETSEETSEESYEESTYEETVDEVTEG